MTALTGIGRYEKSFKNTIMPTKYSTRSGRLYTVVTKKKKNMKKIKRHPSWQTRNLSAFFHQTILIVTYYY